MRQPVLPILVVLLICSADIESAFAKGGRGGGRGRSAVQTKGRNHTSGPHRMDRQYPTEGSRSFSHPRHTRIGGYRPANETGDSRGRAAPTRSTPVAPAEGSAVGSGDAPNGYAPPRQVHLRNEQRKLDHRLSTAEHLRENAARNGNQNLLDVADRMEQRAYEHHDRRLGRVGGGDTGIDDLPEDAGVDAADDDGERIERSGRDGPFDARPRHAGDVAGSELDSFARHQLNEERKLQHQLDVAQRIRDIAARNGNENLLNTAANMEEMAARRYELQMEKFADWNSVPSLLTQ